MSGFNERKMRVLGMKDSIHRGSSLKIVRSRYDGFLLLQMMIAILLGMIIYYFSFVRPSQKEIADQMASPDTYPWVQEGRIGTGHQHYLQDEQLFRETMIELNCKVLEESAKINTSRGKMTLFISPDGQVSGGWSSLGYYMDDGSEYQVMGAEFSGNTDPSKIYSDTNGEDRSLLYFITKGEFLLLKTDSKGRVSSPAGEIFVVGWLRTDSTAFGQVHLTPDRVKQHVFTWNGRPPINSKSLKIDLGQLN